MAALERDDDPLADEYALAAQAAEDAARVARGCGEYPLLSTGDINISSLFVERASHLARADGIVGLLTPPGLAADKGAAPFFRTIPTTGRPGDLFAFAHQTIFCPHIPASLQFFAVVFRGPPRPSTSARCASF